MHIQPTRLTLLDLPFLIRNISISVIISWIGWNCPAAMAQAPNTSEWRFYAQRTELAPAYWIENKVLFKGRPTLALAGNGKNFINGSWRHRYDIQPGRFYRLTTYFKPKNIKQLNRSILAQLAWFDDSDKQVGFVEFPAPRAREADSGWYVLQQIYQAPAGASEARIDLILRWSAGGTVHFGGTTLQQVTSIPSRKVRLATVHHRPVNTANSKASLHEFGAFLNLAGEQGADIVCLPEAITLVGTGKTFLEVSEPVPGPTTKYLGQLAKKHDMYIVAGLVEKEAQLFYNTAVLLDRNGKLAGKYRKASLPREEIDEGLTPGNSFPVFDTDFGKIGILICWDLHFPESARMLALQGAEVILFPNWDSDAVLVKARSIENQVYLVSSTYSETMKSGIFDRNGKLLREATSSNPVAIVDVDLNKNNIWPWVGNFKNRLQRELPDIKAIKYESY